MISLDVDEMSDEQIRRALVAEIQQNQRQLKLLDAYYEGAKRLQAMGLALPPEMEKLALVINWPGMYVDALEERLDIEGFRLGGSADTDEQLWDWWQANDLDEESGLAHLEAMILERAFVTVGGGDSDSDAPVITVDSPRNMAMAVDHRTRKVQAAARQYNHRKNRPQNSVLYLPNRTVNYRIGPSGGWEIEDIEEHNLGVAPVVPLVNRARIGRREGVTEMRDVMDLSDAACRTITNLQGAQEQMAMPQRYLFGATEEDFQDRDGNPVPAWEAYTGRFLMLSEKDATAGQWPAAELRNFTEVINQYARIVSAMTGLPPHYLGFTSDNPASADAIRSSESRLVKKAERKQRAFGGDWERVMRLALLVAGEDPNRALRLETVWRDPSTPTVAAKADAVTKLVQTGILPKEAAWEQLGYSPEYRKRLSNLTSRDPAARFLAAREAAGDPAVMA